MTSGHGRPIFALAGIAIVGVLATVAPSFSPTAASWTASEWDHADIGTSAFDCGTDPGFATTAYAKYLGGGVLGIDLDSIAEISGVTASRSGASAPDFLPAGATHVPGGENQDTYLNPLDITALGTIGIDLSGFTLGLPSGSAGAVNQLAQVSNLGYSAAASGLLSDAGGVGVTSTTPDDELPDPATIGLSTLLPENEGVSDVALQVGAVAASSSLDWCAALESTTWGDGSVDGSDRQYGIAGLGLAVDSPLIATLLPRVQTALATVNTAIAGLQGTTGSIAQSVTGVLTGAGGVLEALNLGSVTGDVTLTGLDLTAVTGLLSGPGAVLSDGVVTLDLADPSGTILVDLAELVGGPDQLNNLDPNTELVINADVINGILTRVGSLVQGWANTVTTALLAAVSAVRLVIDLDVTAGLTVPAVGPVDILTVSVDLDTQLGELLVPDGTPPVATVSASALSSVTGLLLATVNGLLNTLLGLDLTGVVSGINANVALPGQILTAVTSTVTASLVPIVNTLVTDLTAVATQLVTALGAVLGSLPTILSVMVNVQPDQPGAPPGVGYAAGTPPSLSQEYRVTALRIGLAESGIDAPVYLNLATASVGPNSRLP